MSFAMNWKPDILDFSVQINDGLTQTSGDGTGMAFDSKYGIMFCFYMRGRCPGQSVPLPAFVQTRAAEFPQ